MRMIIITSSNNQSPFGLIKAGRGVGHSLLSLVRRLIITVTTTVPYQASTSSMVVWTSFIW